MVFLFGATAQPLIDRHFIGETFPTLMRYSHWITRQCLPICYLACFPPLLSPARAACFSAQLSAALHPHADPICIVYVIHLLNTAAVQYFYVQTTPAPDPRNIYVIELHKYVTKYGASPEEIAPSNFLPHFTLYKFPFPPFGVLLTITSAFSI